MTKMIRWMAVALLATLMAACGGGGGSAGTNPQGGGGGSGGGGAGGDGSTPTVTPTVVVSVIDGAGNSVNSLTIGGSFSAKATVTDATGAPVPSRLVTFSVNNSSIATLTPDTALTDSSGVAKVGVAPASITALGATTLSASALIGGSAYSGTKDFSVSASSLGLSDITLGSASLPSGGNTSVSITALIGGTPVVGTLVTITFSPSCGRINNASSFAATTNGSGIASVAYSAVNADGSLCSGPVNISATAPGATPKTATLNVAVPVANAIAFVSANPQQIFVSGSGAVEQSVVTFKVTSGTTPLTNVPVQFSIITNPGGVGLSATGSTSPVTVTTDSSGLATVSVFSGTIPGPVKVRAALVSNASVFAETQNLTVASGPPSQRFISVSVSTFNIEGANIDGTPTTITARLADRQGNPVEDGTVVNFTAEGGQVAQSCATTRANGIASCSVTFISQNPRADAKGRYSVLAFASGTKDYVDVNGNNKYDPGVDTLINIGDAYRDDNENGQFDAGEFVVPRGGAASCAGSGEPFPARINTCDSSLATTVRQQTVVLFSTTAAKVTPVVSAGKIDFLLGSVDPYSNLPMPSGTTWTAEATGGTCAIDKMFATTVGNVPPGTDPNADLRTSHTVTLKTCATGDTVFLKITAPSGLTTIVPVQIP